MGSPASLESSDLFYLFFTAVKPGALEVGAQSEVLMILWWDGMIEMSVVGWWTGGDGLR